MSDVTRLLQSIEEGDPDASEALLPLVYDELRKLAAARMARENPGHTLQATELVHDAYIRLVDTYSPQQWESRGHFFCAAAEAMRRILVESARRKTSLKRGGNLARHDIDLCDNLIANFKDVGELLDLDQILDSLAEVSPRKAQLVKLRYFLGHTVSEAAEILGIAERTAEDDWTYARAWLRRQWVKLQRTSEF